MRKKYKYTIGIDPSGSFKEGKGTTGWCVLDNTTNTVIVAGTISAKNFETYQEYWNAHLLLIKGLKKEYTKSAVSIEDYILYKTSAMAQVNSQMETVQLIGIIKHFCWEHHFDWYMRPAVAVKARWSDTILLHKGIISKLNKHYVLPVFPAHALCEHERDAIRHAVHFNVFENKEVIRAKK